MTIRVLVVDDSAFARKVIREVLSAAGDIEVVGIARDGLDALEKLDELKPDVLTLDLMMPHLDGLGTLQALPSEGGPRVVVVSTVDEDSELGVAALRAGAMELVHKPTALAVAALYEIGDELRGAVRAAAAARPLRDVVVAPPVKLRATSDRIVVLGTSTGGPQALARLVRAIPAEFPAPIAIALHIPPGYTEALAHRLDADSPVEVVEAADGMELRPGRVVLARAGHHLKIVGRGAKARARLDLLPADTLHRPAVDVLFESAVEAWGADTIAVVLTGMGDDGTRGARRVRAAGGTVITETETTCVVYGMPRAVVEAGVSDRQVPLDRVVQAITEYL